VSEHTWATLSGHFACASELPEAEREQYLDKLEAAKPELGAEVRRLFAAAAVANDFLEPPSRDEVAEPMRLLSFDFRGLKLGEFELVKEIGRGASGVVYSGKQEALGRKVAIKILAPHLVGSSSARERFQREARAASSLRHAAVVNVLSYGEQRCVVYLVLEYVEGKSLHQYLEALRIARNTPRPVAASEDVSRPQVAATIALKLAEGLEYCHSQGVLHRDIKPQNILLEGDLSPRIVDFGLAKDLKLDGITDAGLVSGTLHYMSPEQAQARSGELDSRTDIYSLGVVLYEMLTLQRPFGGAANAQLVERVLHERPVPPHHIRPGVPRALSAVCVRALQKSPGDRYASAAELAKDLRAYLRGHRVAVGARLRFEDFYRYIFIQRPWIAVTGLVLLFGLIIIIAPKALTRTDALAADAVNHESDSRPSPRAVREAVEDVIKNQPEEARIQERERLNEYLMQRLREQYARNEGTKGR
jgi:serine/threonine protein kinase